MTVAGGMRWSGTERAWCGLFTVLEDGRIFCRHEVTWFNKTPEHAAQKLIDFCAERQITLSHVVAQKDLFPKAGEVGETVSETFSRAGVPMRQGSSDRLACWSRLRSWLASRQWTSGKVSPALLIHPDCKFLIRTLPVLVKNDTEPDDVDETPDEYPAMGVALYAMSRPSPWLKAEVKKDPDPLSGAYLWNELRQGAENSGRYVGWNRRRV